MDPRIEEFLADVLALEGEKPEVVSAGVHVALGDVETIFRAREDNRRMKDRAVHACHALCRSRLAEEMKQRRGTSTADHLKLVLGILDRPTVWPSNNR
jgi:pyridoxine 5'-phosphate synthase PdxJ